MEDQAQIMSTKLVEQLSRNSEPYRDPIARIDWDRLDLRQYWLPPEALSLHGVPAFMALPEILRIRVSQYEFLSFIEAGLWLEGMFMERIARSMTRRQNRISLKYRLHEVREEAGHSLMFLELMERSGLSLPPRRRLRVWAATLFGRHAPLESLTFWLATLLGEEMPDRLNRYIRRHGELVCTVVTQMSTLHLIDEARHITYARDIVEQRLRRLRAWERPLLRLLIRKLLHQFSDIFYYPEAGLYEAAGLIPGERWVELAHANRRHRDFVRACLNPMLEMFRQRGFPLTEPAIE